jgi:phosphonate transport system permease protein
LLVGAFLWSLLSVDWNRSLVHSGGLFALQEIATAAIDPELSTTFLILAIKSAWTTLAYALAGICIAIVIGLPMGVLASGVLTNTGALRIVEVPCFRFALAFFRAIHELVWAWLFVVALGLSPVAAILALAIPYSGILGRIYADILNDVPNNPLKALRTSGASELKVLIYGRIPMALPDMVSYSFYRLECAIRATAIMGFVGIQGLGFQLQLSLNDLNYDEMWTLLYVLIGIIVVVDVWSSWVRRSITP